MTSLDSSGDGLPRLTVRELDMLDYHGFTLDKLGDDRGVLIREAVAEIRRLREDRARLLVSWAIEQTDDVTTGLPHRAPDLSPMWIHAYGEVEDGHLLDDCDDFCERNHVGRP